MVEILKNIVADRVTRNGGSLEFSDVLDGLSQSLPPAVGERINNLARSIANPAWLNYFQIKDFKNFRIEIEVRPLVSQLATRDALGVHSSAALAAVRSIWNRHLFLGSQKVEIKELHAESRAAIEPGPHFVRFELSPEQLDFVTTALKESGSAQVDCAVKVCNEEGLLVTDIMVVCEFQSSAELSWSAGDQTSAETN